MEWKLDDSRSIWPQLKEQLMSAIARGVYTQGEAFPTVRQLAQDAGVNRNTMQRAMSELEAEGLLITNRTAGRTVTTDRNLIEGVKRRLAQRSIDAYLEEMAALGYSREDAIAMMNERGKKDE